MSSVIFLSNDQAVLWVLRNPGKGLYQYESNFNYLLSTGNSILSVGGLIVYDCEGSLVVPGITDVLLRVGENRYTYTEDPGLGIN